MMEKLNERLLYLRKNANLTQQQLADKLHISNKTISQWETGRTLPDIVMLVRLAEIYDMKLDELLNQKDQNAIPNEIMTKTLLMGNYKDYLLFASQAEAKRRLAHQMSQEAKIAKADVVLYNNSNKENLERQICDILKVIRR